MSAVAAVADDKKKTAPSSSWPDPEHLKMASKMPDKLFLCNNSNNSQNKKKIISNVIKFVSNWLHEKRNSNGKSWFPCQKCVTIASRIAHRISFHHISFSLLSVCVAKTKMNVHIFIEIDIVLTSFLVRVPEFQPSPACVYTFCACMLFRNGKKRKQKIVLIYWAKILAPHHSIRLTD